MAMLERNIQGNFHTVLQQLHDTVINGSISASYEHGTEYEINDVKVAVRVYERYSWLGGNRVSMTVTLTGYKDQLHITAITSGGSQAMFFKVNTFGEESFLNCIRTMFP